MGRTESSAARIAIKVALRWLRCKSALRGKTGEFITACRISGELSVSQGTYVSKSQLEARSRTRFTQVDNTPR